MVDVGVYYCNSAGQVVEVNRATHTKVTVELFTATVTGSHETWTHLRTLASKQLVGGPAYCQEVPPRRGTLGIRFAVEPHVGENAAMASLLRQCLKAL